MLPAAARALWRGLSAGCVAVAANDLVVSAIVAPDDGLAPAVRRGDVVAVERLGLARWAQPAPCRYVRSRARPAGARAARGAPAPAACLRQSHTHTH